MTQCVSSCQDLKYQEFKDSTCGKPCTETDQEYTDEDNTGCVGTCPGRKYSEETQFEITIRRCKQTCEYAVQDGDLMRCVSKCPSGYEFYKKEEDGSTKLCLAQCDVYESVSADGMLSCLGSLDNCKGFTIAQQKGKLCVANCNGYIRYDDKTCVTACPSWEFRDIGSELQCVEHGYAGCEYLVYSQDHDQYECSTSCSGYVEERIISNGNIGKVCVTSCESGYFESIT